MLSGFRAVSRMLARCFSLHCLLRFPLASTPASPPRPPPPAPSPSPVPHVPPRLVGFVHPPTEVYYDGLNLSHKVCDGSGEDPSCADQWLLPLGVSDHVTYLGIDFVAEWLKCNL